MRVFVFAILLHSASAVIHSLKYFSVGSSGLTNLPEFVCVGELDGVEMFRYDSNTSRAQPTQDWIHTLKADDPDLWREERENLVIQQHHFKKNMDSLRKHFNQSRGVHMLQRIHSCEWDDETRHDGFMKYGYDGEDFISFDLKTQTWVPPKNQALITKHIWDNDRTGNIQLHHFLTQECPRRLRKYLHYGNSSLLRTEVPSVFLLQRSPSSPISCMATGFFPDRAVLFWTKDGEELHEGVDIGESLPNHDGTFQTSADLDPPQHDDWHRYRCVFQLSGLKEDLVTTLDKAAVRSNADKGDIIPIVLGVVGGGAAAALLLLGGLALFLIYRKKMKWEKVASDPTPNAGVPSEEKKSSSSSGTVKKPTGSGSGSDSDTDSTIDIPDECETPRPDTKAPPVERSLSPSSTSTSDKKMITGNGSHDSLDSAGSQSSGTPLVKVLSRRGIDDIEAVSEQKELRYAGK